MKKVFLSLLLVLVIFNIYSTPDRAFRVIDTLIGFRENSYVIKQYVFDNLNNHYEELVQVFLIEKQIMTGEIITIEKITEYKETYDTDSGSSIRSNRSEDRLVEIINKYPDLFYDLHYILPQGVPDTPSEKYSIIDNEIIIRDNIQNIDEIFKIEDYIKINVEATKILQVYKYRNRIILLIEFGQIDSNYYQKIVVLTK